MLLRPLAPALLAATLVACAEPAPSWRDQLVADGPCYRVNVRDGLDESGTAEVNDLFDCVNRGGQLDAMSPAVAALESPTRDDVPAGVEVARLINALPAADVDPFALGGVALDLLRAEDRPIRPFLDLYLELAYGTRAERVRDGTVDVRSADQLRNGVLVPLAPVLPELAEALLDDDLDAATYAAEKLADPEAKRWVRTVGAWTASDDPRVAGPVGRLLPELGALIAATRSPENDRAFSTSGDSLRDFARVFVGGDPLIVELADPADAILSDAVVRPQLEAKIAVWHDDGHLQEVPDQLRWLASIDVDGNGLPKGETSALHALVRLLHDTNRPMQCSLDLWVTNIDFDVGNLAVAILGLIAGQDPDLVQSGVGIIGSVLGWDLTGSIMTDIADSGVCPAFTPQVVHDLGAVDRLYDDRAYDLLVVFVDALGVLRRGQQDRIPDLADLATSLEAGGGTVVAEELIRDIGDEAAMTDLIALVPILADPGAYGLTAGAEPAVDLHDAFGLVVWVFADDAGRTGLERILPLVSPVVDEPGAWEAEEHFGRLLAEEGSQAGRAFELVPPLLAVDPDLVTLDQIAALIGDPTLAGPLLRVLETDGVGAALLAADPPGDPDEVPVGYVGRLVADGTVDEVLATVDVILRGFGGLTGSP